MAAQFINARASVDSTNTTIYSIPGNGEKSIVIGLNVSNIFGSTLPVSIKHTQGGVTVYVAKNKRIASGKTEEFMKGNKLVLLPGDTVTAQVEADYRLNVTDTSVPKAFDVVASILKGVS